MANVPFPPLFCSTPPPIDDVAEVPPPLDDDDADFGEFADAYQENLNYMENDGDVDDDDNFNDFHNHTSPFHGHVSDHESNNQQDIPKMNLNCDLIKDDTTDIESSKENDENANKNYQEVDFDKILTNNHATSLSSLSEQQTSSATSISSRASKSPTIESPKIDASLEDDKDFGDFQFDKSIEVAKSDSGRSTENESISHEIDERPKVLPTLSNIVVLEDLSDDSSDDERRSPRKNPSNICCDESSSDFFAIHPIERSQTEDESYGNKERFDNVESLLADSFKSQLDSPVPEHCDQKYANETILFPENSNCSEKSQKASSSDSSVPRSADMIKLTEIKTSSISPENEDQSISDNMAQNLNEIDGDDDFANFQDFSSEPVAMHMAWPTTNNTNVASSEELPESTQTNEVVDAMNDDVDDDDDDFGDFSEAPVVPTSSQVTTSAVAKQPITEHFKSVLEMMFPNVSSPIESNQVKLLKDSSTNAIELAFVESAKALDYQWPSSIVRHAFIKSLAIDSRNIFLTEKWNPSMPRFAANLSFDPLQPLKPTTVPLQSENILSSTGSSKSDVPVAEFDWKSSGLVNPLDASHVHTLLLDVDQLVVVANLDNINLDSSSSSCSQTSSSTTTTTTTTTAATTPTAMRKTESTNINGTTLGMKTTTKTTTTTTTTTTETTSSSKTLPIKTYNGTIIGAFHGDDNLLLNSIETQCTETNVSACGTNAFETLCQTGDDDTIIDLHETGNLNILLPTIVTDNSQNSQCLIPFPMHNRNRNTNTNNYDNHNTNNNNNNLNTSLAALNAIDTKCFDDNSVTTTASPFFNLLIPTTSVAFTNHLQFNNELHHSLLTPQTSSSSFNLTPILSSTTTSTITTTTTNKTTTTPQSTNEITNIVHHLKNMQMQMPTMLLSTSKCLNTNQYWEFRSEAEMARESIDASKAEFRISSDSKKNSDTDTGSGNSSSSSSHTSRETSTVAVSTTGGTLSSNLSGGSNIIDCSDKNFNHDINVGLYDVCSVSSRSSSTTVPKDITEICSETPALDLNDIPKIRNDSKVLDPIDCTILDPTISLDIYNIDGNAEVRIENGVISRSTYAGPLKETHIFTPSKNTQDIFEKSLAAITPSITMPTAGVSNSSVAPKVFPIDFDYEKAAAGIIIDETVVHKEYRDIEYNPSFGLDGNEVQHSIEESIPPKSVSTLSDPLNTKNQRHTQNAEEEIDDEFSDFQSVPPPESIRTATPPRTDKLSTPTSVNGMILSPAILLPQAISLESKQPKIEWGDSVANIDPEELARIEQLFPQDNNISRSSSKKSTPTHTLLKQSNSLSISGTIANKTQDRHTVGDDDDWSDFVSVPVPAAIKSASRSPQKSGNENNEDEWSDFVSSAPSNANSQASIANYRLEAAATTATSHSMQPQFNSASWQNANFYNNPLSIYHRNHMPNMNPTKLQQQKQNNNYTNHNSSNNNNRNNHSHKNYANSRNNNNQTQQQQYLPKYPGTQQQQKIQVMQDFSTSASDFIPYRPTNVPFQSNYTGPTGGSNNTPFQVGSAKVAPTVSLIPDLGFVAPAMPVHTAIVNSLPKPPSVQSMKK